ncbi:MAG: ubiquinone/menaquinone biosynthesis methyltransferase, partial [Bacteroidota bacterium]
MKFLRVSWQIGDKHQNGFFKTVSAKKGDKLPSTYTFAKQPRQGIGAMFDTIAHRYDFLNHLLSLGMDRRWRVQGVKALQSAVGRAGASILDVATGTGDLAIAALQMKPPLLVGIDVSREMLSLAQKKFFRYSVLTSSGFFVQAAVEHLPIPSEIFDAAMVAYGVRNFADLQQGLREIHRVLKPGGRFLVIEFSLPKFPVIRQLYLFYFGKLLPSIGRFFSGSRYAYSYLPASVEQF